MGKASTLGVDGDERSTTDEASTGVRRVAPMRAVRGNTEPTALVAKLWRLLTARERRGIVVLMTLITVGIALETLGLSMVVPTIVVITQEDVAATYPAARPFLEAMGNPDREALIVWGLTFLVSVYLIKSLYLAFLALVQNRFIFDIRVRVSEQLYATYLAQPWTFHLQRNSSRLIRNILGETNMLIQSALSPLMKLVTEGLLMVWLLVVLLLVEPVGAIAVAIVLGLAAGGFYGLIRNHVSKWGRVRQYHEGLRIQHLQQGLNGAKDVKLLGREREFLESYRRHNGEATRMVRNQTTLNQMPRLWLEFLAVVGLAVLVATMMLQGRQPDNVLPTLGLFAAVAFRMMPSVNKLVSALQSLRFGGATVDNIYAELQLPVAEPSDAEPEWPVELHRQIRFHDVSFTYPGAHGPALHDVELEVRKGESVGLIGHSGSGKSTVVDLLLGILMPTRGSICVDGTDIRENLRNWQRQIGYVPQTIYLTDDTLRRNVAFGVAEDAIDDGAVLRALNAAQLDTLISSLSDGVDSVVGEHGVRLSGGQRQRIGIARALYHDPDVLVLDEATSALDTETEREVMDAVMALHGKKTVMIVAHRLTTVSRCDRIYRLREGRVIEQGPAEVVLAEQRPEALEQAVPDDDLSQRGAAAT